MKPIEPQSPSAEEARGTDAHTEGADAASAPLRSMPLFHYESLKGAHKLDAIAVQHEIFHQINNMDDFSDALGNNKDAKNSRLFADEFIWDRYTRDGAKMSQHCLQSQISAYLHNNSAKFRVLYQNAFDTMLGKCNLSVIDGMDLHCAACPMHPSVTV